jgi:hypothetical protein
LIQGFQAKQAVSGTKQCCHATQRLSNYEGLPSCLGKLLSQGIMACLLLLLWLAGGLPDVLHVLLSSMR